MRDFSPADGLVRAPTPDDGLARFLEHAQSAAGDTNRYGPNSDRYFDRFDPNDYCDLDSELEPS